MLVKNIWSTTCILFHLPVIDHLDESGRFFELRIAELASAVTGWIRRVGPQHLWRWELLRTDFALQFRVHV